MITRLLITGYTRNLVREDLWPLNDEERAENLAKEFEKEWTFIYERR